MPYFLEFDPNHRVVQCKFSGRISDQELKDFYRVAAESADSLQLRGAILDLSGVTSFQVTMQTIRTLAKAVPVIKNPMHPRVIVAPALHIFLLARIFETEGEAKRPSLHVVRKMQEAWAILGIADPQFKPLDERPSTGPLKAFEWKKNTE